MAEPAGWSLAADFATGGDEAAARNFYALYEGTEFGMPGRGALAIIARAHADGRSDTAGARGAVQSMVHGFAEGYFGARRTISVRKAAASALASLNRWLAGQMQGEAGLAPVSLSALLLQDKRIGLAQVGRANAWDCRQPASLFVLLHPADELGVEGCDPSIELGPLRSSVGDQKDHSRAQSRSALLIHQNGAEIAEASACPAARQTRAPAGSRAS